MKNLIQVLLAELSEAALIFTVAALKGAGVTTGICIVVVWTLALVRCTS
jgi:hypothetical protein